MVSSFDQQTGYARADGLLPGAVASAVGYSSDGDLPRLHRGLPSPYLTFIISLDGPVVGGYTPEQATGERALRADVLAAGLHTAASYVVQPERQSGLQLAIYPPAVRRLLATPLGEITDQSWNAADLLGRSATRLWERVGNTEGWAERFAVLQGFLTHQLDRSDSRRQMRPELLEAWKWLVRHRGAGSIGGLSEHVLLSRRQVQTLFVREFGVGPKMFNRLLRYHRSIRLISARISEQHSIGDVVDDHPAGAAGVDLARIAAECGFADQSHLNRDFVAFTGVSPTAWIAEEFPNIVAGGHRNGDADDPAP
ncbi:AraC family transcriptional regulator [Microlunatus soli]|uniref:AraC-type DNA-binding protein n=1 Tax=Microlunatus soli TaxID=630515 RepID=A0A1H1T932_9ACTN|nr:helix-turn-helix domain-containing protein [Microlunatus soli]SDS56651.1 AraC-type DNA-binding protein [Microlunatus soli]